MDRYEATALCMGRRAKASGASVYDAIAALDLGNVKGKVILTVSHGTNSKDRILMPFHAQRLFNSAGLSREVAIKHAANLFQGI